MHDHDAPEDTDLVPYTPVELRARHDGWTVERQRIFLTALAETGSISLACTHAGVSARSAYRLRARLDARAFADAWHVAIAHATQRLVTLAFERATRGAVRETWKDGVLVSETRAPSDKLLMFLLERTVRSGKNPFWWSGTATFNKNAADCFEDTLEALLECDSAPDVAADAGAEGGAAAGEEPGPYGTA